jgi:hypothetical protein
MPSDLIESALISRLTRRDFPTWAARAASTGHCSRPIRVYGSVITRSKCTGEILSRYHSREDPDGITYLRCGNRRASVCLSCSHEYKGDVWHLLFAGAVGGHKGVLPAIGSQPLVFATLTAPSFGSVHTSKRPGSHRGRRCRPRAGMPRCRHGNRDWCMTVHEKDDRKTGQPFCTECYDYESQVIWQWFAPELWRRFTITLHRQIAARLGLPQSACRKLVRVQFAKVAEFQSRGAVHFHALIRFDRVDSHNDGPDIASNLSEEDLIEIVKKSAQNVHLTAPRVDDKDDARILRFGAQVDTRLVKRGNDVGADELTDAAVAAYIAKYATKSVEDIGSSPEDQGDHFRRIKSAALEIARRSSSRTAGGSNAYRLLPKWVGMLGFRGHFMSKSRRYSVTLGYLRNERRQFRRRQGLSLSGALSSADLSHVATSATWKFAGTGWLSAGDAELAAMAATQALSDRSSASAASRNHPSRERTPHDH